MVVSSLCQSNVCCINAVLSPNQVLVTLGVTSSRWSLCLVVCVMCCNPLCFYSWSHWQLLLASWLLSKAKASVRIPRGPIEPLVPVLRSCYSLIWRGEKCRSGTLSRPHWTHIEGGEQISILEVFLSVWGSFHLSPGGGYWEGECFLNNWCATFVLEFRPFIFFRTHIVSGASLTFLSVLYLCRMYLFLLVASLTRCFCLYRVFRCVLAVAESHSCCPSCRPIAFKKEQKSVGSV